MEEHILWLKIFQTQVFTPSFHIPPYHDIFSVNLGSAELIGSDAACSRDRLMGFNGEKYVCSLCAMSKNSGAQNKRAVPTHSAHVSLELLFCTPSYFSLNHLLNTAFTDVYTIMMGIFREN